MYDKKYCLEKIEEFNRHNYIYEDAEGSVCYPAYFKVGERGLFLYEVNKYEFSPVHRIHTTAVKNVEYGDGVIVVETQNTKLMFRVIEE